MTRFQRILLVDGSPFLRDILRRVLEKTTRCSIVGEIEFSENLSDMIRETHANLIIISLPPGSKLPRHFRTLMLTEFPSIRVLGISSDGSEVRLEWVDFHEKDFRGLTFDEFHQLLVDDFDRGQEEDA